jgi:hypothetical protein
LDRNPAFDARRGPANNFSGYIAEEPPTPALPTVNTPTVVIRLTINTFSDIVGCNVTLQGSLAATAQICERDFTDMAAIEAAAD